MFPSLVLFMTFLLLILLSVLAQCKLQQVVSAFRHGARSYLHQIYDADSDRQFWGELTPVGMRQHQKLGQLIRKDYIEQQHFLNSSFNFGEIEVFTTDLNRTFESARSHVYGLYPLFTGPQMPSVSQKYRLPPYSRKQDSRESNFALTCGHQPIPISINASVLLLSCPLAGQEMNKNQIMRLSTYQEMNMTYFPFMKRMGSMFNLTTLNFSNMINLYDTLQVDQYKGRPLPSDFTREDFLNLQHLTNWYSYFRLTNNVSKAFNTPVLNRVLQDFDGRINKKQDKALKWTFLSAHDTNLFCLTGDLNISSSDCIQQKYRKGATTALNCFPGPQFASSLIFELHSDDSLSYFVKIRYNGEYVFLCEKKETICSYQQWKQRVKDSIIVDDEKVYQICNGNNKKEKLFFEDI